MLATRAYIPGHQLPDGRPAAWPWPYDVPCVAQLARDGMEFSQPLTFLVGENGSGKSTLVEALAEHRDSTPRVVAPAASTSTTAPSPPSVKSSNSRPPLPAQSPVPARPTATPAGRIDVITDELDAQGALAKAKPDPP